MSFINPKSVVVAVFSVFFITTTLLIQAAEAAETTVVSWKGTAAEAYVSTEDDSGLHNDVYIYASDGAHKQDSNKSASSVAYVNVYQYRAEEVCDVDESGPEQCWDQYVNVLAFDGFAILADPEAFETNGLTRATLDASIAGFDSVSNTTKTITIDAIWNGLGETSNENYVSNYHTGDYVFHGKASGFHRLAKLGGNISGGDVSINLDPDSASFNEGSLHDSKSGYIQISK